MAPSGDLEARIALLEDEQAILKNLYRYGHSIDYGDEEAWVDCFTEDGVFDVRATSSASSSTGTPAHPSSGTSTS
jgi:3-phenylpropionate/cinnamic acid dioxygenase small subunit